MKKEKIIKKCENCGKEIFLLPCKIKQKYCCKSCADLDQKRKGIRKGKCHTSLDNFIRLYGEKIGKEKYDSFVEKTRNNALGNTFSVGRKLSEETKNKIRNSVKKTKQENKYKRQLNKNDNLSKNKGKGTYSLEWFILKYGELEGNKLYIERCKKISKNSFFRIYNKTNGQNISKLSQKLFWNIYKRLNLKKEEVYFFELNHEFGCGTNTNFDFVWKNKKKIIEFNGDIWHANPKYFKENEQPNPFNDLTSKEIWENDKSKIKKAELNGYKVLVIWENDYKKNSNEIENNCIDFLIGDKV